MLFEQYEHRVTESQPDVRTADTYIRGATVGSVCRAVFWNLFFELKQQAGLGFEIYVDNDLEDDCRCRTSRDLTTRPGLSAVLVQQGT